MKILAHNTEEGEQELQEHLENVSGYSKKIVERKNLSLETLEESKVQKLVQIIGSCHDFGKSTTYFQKYLRGRNNFQEKYKNHSLISAYYTFHCIQKKEGFNDRDAILAWLIVLKHHGDLESIFDYDDAIIRISEENPSKKDQLTVQAEDIRENLSDIEKIYQRLNVDYVESFVERAADGEIFNDLLEVYDKHDLDLYTGENMDSEFEDGSFEKNTENFFLTLFCYSVLLDSDKMDTVGFTPEKEKAEKEDAYELWPSVGTEPVEIPEDAVDNYKSAQGWDSPESEINKIRKEAYEQAEKIVEEDDDLMTLTLPTGAGKTLTALNMALKMRAESELERPPRIIYSLPFLSIIDQNYDVIQDVLENEGLLEDNKQRPELLLRHDHLSPGYAADESEDENPGNPILLTEGWNSEIVNTTFVQFFETLFSTENSPARKFHKIANSIILLDEIQSLPIKYWEPVEEAFKVLAEKFNTKIVLMTATQPELIEKEDSKEAIPEEKKEGYFEAFDRVDYEFDIQEERSIESLAKEIKDSCGSGKDLMAVLNTRNSCEAVYEKVEKLDDENRKVIFLSTDLLPIERERKIEKIKSLDDTEKSVLVVTTQLIEAGVDIDMDIVWRDFAPLDSIVQTAGRCNREDAGDKGLVKVVELKGENMAFHKYVYDTILTRVTRNVIEEEFEENNVSEKEFNLNAVEKYFEEVGDRKNQDQENVLENIRNLDFSKIDVSLIENSLSVPVFVSWDDEAEEVEDKVREIYDQNSYFERRKKNRENKEFR
jgi:CRISPR-associated endonuclease/helicase Cas3